MSKKFVFAFLIGLLLIKCDRILQPEYELVSVSTDKSVYDLSKPIHVIIKNDASKDIQLEYCGPYIQCWFICRWIDDRWENLGGFNCPNLYTITLKTLKPGRSIEFEYPLHEPGRYRYGLMFCWAGEKSKHIVYSEEFQVGRE